MKNRERRKRFIILMIDIIWFWMMLWNEEFVIDKWIFIE